MRQITARDWGHLHEELFRDSWRADIRRFRAGYAYRGMDDASKVLRTSLIRLGGQAGRQEQHLIRNFRKYAHRSALNSDGVWDWLSLGQHHGLPSRLLDWTYSPYVALHFATMDLDRYGCDGCIWCVDYYKAHKLLPAALTAVLAGEGSDVFTTDMLTRVAPTLADFDSLARPDDPFAVFFEPPSLDERIVNQFAMFSVVSSPTDQLHQWLDRHPDLGHRLIIPAKLKWEVRDKLDQANVTERVLFPGLDGLSAWLKRYYRPRDAGPELIEGHP